VPAGVYSVPEPLTLSATNTIDEFKCNFDKDLCGMMRDVSSNFDFLLHHGSTKTNFTGPTSDHTSGEGTCTSDVSAAHLTLTPEALKI